MMFLLLYRAIKMNLANEGLEARKKDEEVAQRKRKAEDDKTWEGALTVISFPLPRTTPDILGSAIQKTESSVSIAGAALPPPARRRRKRRQ